MTARIDQEEQKLLQTRIKNLKRYAVNYAEINQAAQKDCIQSSTKLPIITLDPKNEILEQIPISANKDIPLIYESVYQKLVKYIGDRTNAHDILDRLTDAELRLFNSSFDSSIRKIKVLTANGDYSRRLYLLFST